MLPGMDKGSFHRVVTLKSYAPNIDRPANKKKDLIFDYFYVFKPNQWAGSFLAFVQWPTIRRSFSAAEKRTPDLKLFIQIKSVIIHV